MEFEKISDLLKDEKYYANNNFVPIIREKSAKFLYDFVRNNNIKKVLEIGTAIGYSGSLIMAGGAESLTTIEIKSEYRDIALKTFQKCGFDKVNSILGDAKDVLKQLVDAGDKFDFIFLDGAKGQYYRYLPLLTRLLNKNGVILADNVLLHGMVESEEKIAHRKRTMVVNLRKYLDIVTHTPYKTELVRIEDGMAITRYEGE